MITLDAIHEAAIERACQIDRQYFAAHPGERRRIREAIPHESCSPVGYCVDGQGDWYIETTLLAEGVRARRWVRLPKAGAA